MALLTRCAPPDHQQLDEVGYAAWTGCLCTRCGLKRNQNHDWEVVECRQHCRRCGWRGEPSHRFEGCVCLACGATRHVWKGNYCTQCHLICTHSETTSEMEMVGADDDSSPTPHGRARAR